MDEHAMKKGALAKKCYSDFTQRSQLPWTSTPTSVEDYQEIVLSP
jgi:hypothetical protein